MHSILLSALSIAAPLLPQGASAVPTNDPDFTAIPSPVTTILATGPSTNRVDVTFIGDGYRAEEIETTYHDHVWNVIEDMITPGEALYNTEPYITYANYLNFHRINLVSAESGIDFPAQGIYVNTALDGTDSCIDYTRGLCQVTWAKVDGHVDASLRAANIDREWLWITFNIDVVVGGAHTSSGGSFAIYSGDGGRGPLLAGEHAFHEGGHAFHHLLDEYWNYPLTTYSGPEPSQVNVTTNSDPNTVKWARWIGYDDPTDDLSPIGVYEGGMTHRWGIWRPTVQSRMRYHASYDAIAREKIILDIYRSVRPLDAWTDTAPTYGEGDIVSVQPVDPAVVKVDWLANGWTLIEDGGLSVRPSDYLGQGAWTIAARTYDDTPMVRVEDRSLLEQTVEWQFVLTNAQWPASATVRNGSGVNPVNFTSTSLPVLGSPWTSEIDTAGHSSFAIGWIFGFDAPLSGVYLPFGELLVDVTKAKLIDDPVLTSGGVSSHSLPIPLDLNLAGFTAHTQSFILSGNRRLGNAIDLVLGF